MAFSGTNTLLTSDRFCRSTIPHSYLLLAASAVLSIGLIACAGTEESTALPTFTVAPTAVSSLTIEETAAEARALYLELLTFRDDPEFIQVGFGTCCRFNQWLQRVEVLREQSDDRSFFREYDFTLGELQGYGIAHVGGRPTGSYDLELDKKIRVGLGLGATQVNQQQAEGCSTAIALELAMKDFDGAALESNGDRWATSLITTGDKVLTNIAVLLGEQLTSFGLSPDEENYRTVLTTIESYKTQCKALGF